MHRSHSHCGGAGTCGWTGCVRLTDGDDAGRGAGASTSRAAWNGCCTGFGGGVAAGAVYGGSGRH